jgi:hypothetical protein
MLLFSQGCLDLDVSGPITAFKQILLRKYFPGSNNSHRGFVERYPHHINSYKTYVINKIICLCETFGHTVKYTVFVGCV